MLDGRIAPLGRSALWLSLGIGIGLALTELVLSLTTGGIVIPRFLPATPLVQALTLLAPLALVAIATLLLVIGTRPSATIRVPLGTAEALLRSGRPGLARVRRVSIERSGRQRLVTVALDARGADQAPVRTRLIWQLDPVDAGMIVRRGVVPVRMSRTSPAIMALDTRADSRKSFSEVDVNEEFSASGILRARLRMLRIPSRWALVIGATAGIIPPVLA